MLDFLPLDLNADLAEGMPDDAALLPFVTTANLCCGAHAGDPASLRATIEAAIALGVDLGAHPGYPDRANFGRQSLEMSCAALRATCQEQLDSLAEAVNRASGKLVALKPHGALYHKACHSIEVADLMIELARQYSLKLVGLPNCLLAKQAQLAGIAYLPEGFADRRYGSDGELLPRSEAHAILNDPEIAANQVMQLVSQLGVRTICVHGDSPGAVAFLAALRQSLQRQGLPLRTSKT